MPGKPWFFYTNTRCTQAALAEVHFGCIMCLYQFCSEGGITSDYIEDVSKEAKAASPNRGGRFSKLFDESVYYL